MASESADLRAHRTALVTAAARVAELRTWGLPMTAAESGELDEKTRQLAQSLKDDYDALATHPLAAAVLPQEAGEPVAWQFSASFWSRYESIPETLRADARPLYAAPQVSPPQARVPLTEDAIWELHREMLRGDPRVANIVTFARAIERAHLIGLETKGDSNG